MLNYPVCSIHPSHNIPVWDHAKPTFAPRVTELVRLLCAIFVIVMTQERVTWGAVIGRPNCSVVIRLQSTGYIQHQDLRLQSLRLNLIRITFKIQFLHHIKHCVFIIRTNPLMMIREIIDVCGKNYMKHINMLRNQTVVFSQVYIFTSVQVTSGVKGHEL